MRKHHNKLYYGKYRYKTEFKMPGSLMFYPTTDEYLTKIKGKYQDTKHIIKLADFIMANRKTMKFRFQNRKVIFYSDYKKSLDLIDNFWDFWIGSKTVDPEFTDLGKNTVGCKRLPHGKFEFQVQLKKDTHNFMSENEKQNLWKFITRNKDQFKITSGPVEIFLNGKNNHLFQGYFYVKEEKYLTPVFMMVQNSIDKVIQFRKVGNGSDKKTKR